MITMKLYPGEAEGFSARLVASRFVGSIPMLPDHFIGG